MAFKARPEVQESDSDLYFGLVRALGTNLADAISALKVCLQRAGFPESQVKVIKLSGFFQGLLEKAVESGEKAPVTLSRNQEGRYQYYKTRMDAGDWCRATFGNDILAQQAIAAVRDFRPRADKQLITHRGHVFIFDSLMHPAEVELLRAVYSKRFFLIAVHSTAEVRAQRLKDEILSTHPTEKPQSDTGSGTPDQLQRKLEEVSTKLEGWAENCVEELLERDDGLSEPQSPLSPAPPERRLAIRRTFSLADLFITLTEIEGARDNPENSLIQRFIEKIFGEPFHTPTRAELGMAHAYVAARRSASLARSVGAAICSLQGDVLAAGTNEVPAAGGGHYWPTYDGSDKDHRDHNFKWKLPSGTEVTGVDSNDQLKLELFNDLVRRILDAITPGDLGKEEQLTFDAEFKFDAPKVISRLFQDDTVRAARFFDLIEYSRTVHAEMSALISCALRGIRTEGAVLYCTTFPCHECSRHIIAAGISRVVYVEPYTKSRVTTLHSDSASVEKFTGPAPFNHDPGKKITFEPFTGISPNRHADLYSHVDRKVEGKVSDPDYLGRKIHWTLNSSTQLRASLQARLPVARLAEDLMIHASEEYVDDTLERTGLKVYNTAHSSPSEVNST